MSTVPPAVPRASSAAFTGPLVWRKVVDWLSADGVISADEAQRTIARCSQAESAQNPLVRLSNVAMARASDGRPLDIEALTEYLAQRVAVMQRWGDYLDKLRVGADVVQLHKAA